MNSFSDDIFTEPSDIDDDALANLGPLRRESQFRVALSLANVGTFGNLKPREITAY